MMTLQDGRELTPSEAEKASDYVGGLLFNGMVEVWERCFAEWQEMKRQELSFQMDTCS